MIDKNPNAYYDLNLERKKHRDALALAAMQGIISTGKFLFDTRGAMFEHIAIQSYKIADAMIDESQK